MTDIDALHQYAQTGDPDAFRVLVEQYQQMVYATCCRRVGPADAEDAAQQTFLKLAQAARTIRGNVGGWLHTTAVNACRDLLRRQSRRGQHEKAAPPPNGHSANVEGFELREALDRALNALSKDHRELIIQRYLLGRSLQEVADEQGVTPSAISQRTGKALAALRKRLETCGVTAPSVAGLESALLVEAGRFILPAGLTWSLAGVGVAGVGGVGAGLGTAGIGLAAKLTAVALVLGVVAAIAGVVVSTASHPNPVASLATIRTVHGVGTRVGEPNDGLEFWYDVQHGYRVEGLLGGRRTIIIDDGAQRWTWIVGEPTATLGLSSTRGGPLEELLGDVRASFAERDPQRRSNLDRSIDGEPALAWEDSQGPGLARLWLDAKGRPVRFEDHHGDPPALDEIGTFSYDLPIDAALFTPDFGESVRIVDHRDALRRYGLDQALLVRPIEDFRLIWAAHEVRRLDNGSIFIMHTLRPQPEVFEQFGVPRGAGDYGDVQLTGWRRDEAGNERLLQAMTLAQWTWGGIDYQWDVLIPKGDWPAGLGDAIDVDAYIHTRNKLQQQLESAGKPWWRQIRPLVNAPLPETPTPLNAVLEDVYQQAVALEAANPERYGPGLGLASVARKATPEERANIGGQDVIWSRSYRPASQVTLDTFRTAIAEEHDRLLHFGEDE